MAEDIRVEVSKMSGDKEDVQNLKEVLDVVSQKIPELLEKVTGAMYGAENAKKFAVAVAEFYKSLKAAGMTEEQAYSLTKEYMSSISLTGFIGKAFEGAKEKHHSKHEHGHGKEYVVYDGDDEGCDEENGDDDEEESKKK